ncbi:MAG: hypothetical protein QXS54_10855, partial [Candidatus Methanomethylicaceae archaeon]
PYIASDEYGAAISGRRVSDIMRELYGNDPLLITPTRTGSTVRHIYERSSAGKTAIGPENMPSYNVRLSIPWDYIIRFEYTKRIPNPCEESKDCIRGDTLELCKCNHGDGDNYTVRCDGENKNCRCYKEAYQGAYESGRILHSLIAGRLFCDKAEDELFPNQCQGVPVPVMEVQSIVR